MTALKWKPFTGVHDKQTFESDVHGHPTGDEVLRAYGSLVDKRVRGKGTVYRGRNRVEIA